MYDLIGDIHGYATPLRLLLTTLGYTQVAGCYRHATRRAIFVGDFIDRGPHIREVLEIVRTMQEHGAALAVMGNHEFNAIAFEAGYREDTPRTRSQYAATLSQLRTAERKQWVDWFRTLPLWLDLGDLRVVHACWNTSGLRCLSQGLSDHGGFTDAFVRHAAQRGTALYAAVDTVLKGPEIPFPPGISTIDADGVPRNKSRIRWYLSHEGQTWKNYVYSRTELPETPVNHLPEVQEPYPDDAPPVFFGHYWDYCESPILQRPNVACLDYSVARDGYLCAYRWSGEQTLDVRNFVTAR